MFTVRVELHDAVYADYTRLHTAMEAAGFSRYIAGDDGRKWHLPTAEYHLSASLSIVDVVSRANKAIASSGKTGEVLVSQATEIRWSNLYPA